MCAEDRGYPSPRAKTIQPFSTPHRHRVCDLRPPAEAAATAQDITQHQIRLVAADAAIAKETSTEKLDEKRDEVASKLRVAMLQEKEKKATEPQNAQPKANESEVDLLKQSEVIIAQQKAAATTLTDIEASEAKLKSQLGELANNQLAEEPPYSITFVDQLRDSVKSLTMKSEAIQASVMTSRDAVELARNSVEEKQRTARQLKEKNPEADLRVPTEEVYVAEQILILRRQELAIAEASARVHALQLAVDQKKIEVIGPQVTFSKELLDQQIAEIEAKEVELTRQGRITSIRRQPR